MEQNLSDKPCMVAKSNILGWEPSIQIREFPYIKGTEVPIHSILTMFSKRKSMQEVLVEFPELKESDVVSALECAAHAFKWEAEEEVAAEEK